jgi:hypothetical protein
MTTDPADLPDPAHDDPADNGDGQTTEDPKGAPPASGEPAGPDDEEESD